MENLLDCELSIEEKENPCKVWANDKSIYVPRLDQLLTEIEKRMFQWELTSYSALPPVLDEEGYPRTYKIQLFDEEGQAYEIGDMANIFSPEEAAALALLWILEQENNDRIKADCQRRSQNPGWMNGNGGVK